MDWEIRRLKTIDPSKHDEGIMRNHNYIGNKK